MDIKAAKSFLDNLNTAIMESDTPLEGDFIALDWDDSHPSDFCKGDLAISWYCSKVISVEPNDGYRVDYDNGDRVYYFKEFGWPKRSGEVNNIYPALPPIQ